MKLLRHILFVLFMLGALVQANAQDVSYLAPREFEIAGISVQGAQFLDESALIVISGLNKGDKAIIPGDVISTAIEKLWKQKLFSDVWIGYEKIVGKQIYLVIHVKEEPRLSEVKIDGTSKSHAEELVKAIDLAKGSRITPNDLLMASRKIENFYIDKGYLLVEVDTTIRPATDDRANRLNVTFNVKKNQKVRIEDIRIDGNSALTNGQIKRSMKETKEKLTIQPFNGIFPFAWYSFKRLFKADTVPYLTYAVNHFEDKVIFTPFNNSKYKKKEFEADKKLVIEKYLNKGFRDARIVKDTLIINKNGNAEIVLTIDEGHKYYFRDIKWIGNSKFTDEELTRFLGIKKGDVFEQARLDQQLYMSQNSTDITSLYMDDGYLFFNLTPVEVKIENDSIDLEIRIREGDQARINKIIINGNTKTNDHVILREIRTKPGELFSRSDIIRTQQELSALGYFNPETMGVNPIPNPANGTVDIEYTVEERPSDQVELSGGWGGGQVVGTLGLSFSNFSLRNVKDPSAWRPLPAGDGQRLSVRAQSTGRRYQSYNISFTEPWLGGKKPRALSFTTWHSLQSRFGAPKNLTDENGDKVPNPNRDFIKITAVSLGLGQRLKWPDDRFFLQGELSYQNYAVQNRTDFVLGDGTSNNLFARLSFRRSSTGDPTFPTSGSEFTASVQSTLPYSYFNGKDYTTISEQERFQWIEYHKWKFTTSWFQSLSSDNKWVLNTRVGVGLMRPWNKAVGDAPFERFYLGGSGLTGFTLDGREIIALRGYDDQSLSPIAGATMIAKYTAELRFLISPSPQARVFALTFVEAGNSWTELHEFNPFQMKKSVGAGIRLFLPMFGLLGLDYGYRLDNVSRFPGMQRGQVHFTIGANLGEL